MIRDTIEIKWALIFTLAQLLWISGERLTGLYTIHIGDYLLYTNLFMIPAIFIYLFALLEKRRRYPDGEMDYKQGLFTGLRITYLTTIMSPLTITVKFILFGLLSNFSSYIYYIEGNYTAGSENEISISWMIVSGLASTPVTGLMLAIIIPLFIRFSRNTENLIKLY